MIFSEQDPPAAAISEIHEAERKGADDPSAGREETYGPIGFRRYVKSDGRALILFTHEGFAHAGPAEGSAHAGPADGSVQGGPAGE
jgi:hypothetical protein